MSCSTCHSFKAIFSITTHNFLTTDTELKLVSLLASAFHLCLCLYLHFAVSDGLHLQSYRNNVEEISGNFKDPTRVDLAFLKKIVNFSRFQNGSLNLLSITSEES